MKSHSKVSIAVASILNAVASGVAMGADTATTPPEEQLTEVIVTAQHRSESIQNVPITMQVLTAETLTQLNTQTFDDLVRFLPNVTTNGEGPGQSEIVFRGLGTAFFGNQGTDTGGTYPTVAIYLDDQSGQAPGRNLDVYAADLERIEVLEGPQGTLFGAGAEAGVLRYITNKPKLNTTESAVNAGYATTAHGDQSGAADAMINLPLIEDHLAVRAVIYDDRRGGYITNLPATFARAPTDKVSVNYFGGAVPPNSGPISNNALAGSAINPVTYTGIRGELLYQVNDDWKVLLK
jgi:iron complex outermembrane recepter protein